MKRCAGILVILFAFGALYGCSNGAGTPVIPDDDSIKAIAGGESHMLWGYYQFTADPAVKTLDYVELRAADMHLNALPFLEPPPLVHLTMENLKFNGNIVEVDIRIGHPFPGLTEFTGFDVCGILISRGSVGGYIDTDILLPGEDDLHLLNPDGFSRWWNPVEFPVNDSGMFGYNDGLLGTPEALAHYSATLNGYKYYCDDLVYPDASLDAVDTEGRGVFSPGKKNVRHYSIQLGSSGLIFNYAIDASWEFPVGSGPPWEAPGDFSPEANRPEAWRIEVEITGNNLWNDGSSNGGGFSLTIGVYDWFNVGMNKVSVESPGNFDPVTDLAPSGSGSGFRSYDVTIWPVTPAYGEIDILVTAESEVSGYGGALPGKSISAYQVISVPVSSEPLEPIEAYATYSIMSYFDGFGPEATPEDPIPTEWLVTLDGSGSTGPIAQYYWELNGDDQYDDGTGMTINRSFAVPGTFVIKLKITDGWGGFDTYEIPTTFTVVLGTYISCQAC